MSGTDPFDDFSPERESLRAALAIVCVLAVVFAAAALPTLSVASAVGAIGSGGVPFDGQPDGTGSPNATDGQTAGATGGNLTPSQQSGPTPIGSETGTQLPGDAAGRDGSGPGGQTSSGDTGTRPNGTAQSNPSGEPGTPTSGDGTGDAAGSDGGDTSGQPDDGDTSGQPDDGDTSGQQSDGQATDADGGTSDGDTSDGPTGDGTDGGDTGGQSSGDPTTDGNTSTRAGGTQTDDGNGTATQTSGGDGSDPSDGSEDQQSDDESDGYRLSLNRSATAGAVVEVTVTRGGQPASGVGVSFNGDRIGTTGEAGTVVGRVPYESRLNITLDSGTEPSLSAPPDPSGDRLFALSGPGLAREANESFTVNTTVSLSFSGPVVTGRPVTVAATIDGVPVRSAAVTLDGERVGTTDDSGTASVQLPSQPGTYTLAVSRDGVSGNRTVTLAGLRVETEPTLPVALPGSRLAVTVTAGGDPVPNATVALSGEAVAETDRNGTAFLSLPIAGSATVTVRQYGQVSETVVGGLFANLAGVLAGAIALAGGAGYLLRRFGVSRAALAGWLRTVTQFAVNGLLWLVGALDSALRRLRNRLALTVAALRAFVARRRTLSQLWTALRAWITTRIGAVTSSAGAAATAARNADPRTADTADDDRTTIRAAWGRLVERVSLRRTGTATPGEIATHAVEEDDIPAEAVGVLREAYRAVEYGQYDPSDHVSAVERAIERIERSADADEDGGDSAA